MNAMSQKNKAAMLDRLTRIFNGSDFTGNKDACLAAIGICMLHIIPTLEEITRHRIPNQNRFDGQGYQAQTSQQTNDEKMQAWELLSDQQKELIKTPDNIDGVHYYDNIPCVVFDVHGNRYYLFDIIPSKER